MSAKETLRVGHHSRRECPWRLKSGVGFENVAHGSMTCSCENRRQDCKFATESSNTQEKERRFIVFTRMNYVQALEYWEKYTVELEIMNENDQLRNYQADPYYYQVKSRLRQFGQIEATPKWLTKKQKEAISAVYREARKLTKLTGVKHVVDHIWPLNERTLADCMCRGIYRLFRKRKIFVRAARSFEMGEARRRYDSLATASIAP